MERYHIIKRGKGWALKRENASKAVRVYDTKENAKEGAERFRDKGFDIIIHKRNGYMEEWKKGKQDGHVREKLIH
jgi:hypothetical protein